VGLGNGQDPDYFGGRTESTLLSPGKCPGRRLSPMLPYRRIPLLIAGALLTISMGCGGGSTSSAQSPLSPSSSPDFSISFSPSTVSVSEGNTSSQVALSVTSLNNFSGSVQITVAGLPTGVTSNPASPFSVSPGATANLLFGAAPSAATGTFTVSAQAVSGTLSHTASMSLTVKAGTVAVPSGTTFAPTDSIPSVDDPVGEPHQRHLVYDPANQHLFVANRAMNSVDVLSSLDGSQVAQISVPGASSVDLSSDGTTVWVGSTTERISAIDTATLQLRGTYALSPLQPVPNVTFDRPEELIALSNGKLFVRLRQASAAESLLALWDPVTNSLTDLTSAAPSLFQNGVGLMARSGDHTKILVTSDDSSGNIALFDSTGALVAGPVSLGSGTFLQASANQDASDFAVTFSSNGAIQLLLLNATLNTSGSYEAANPLGLVFSLDGQTIFLSELHNGTPVITALNATDLSVIGEVPDVSIQGARSEIEDVDASQHLFGLSNRGVALVDAAHPASLPAAVPSFAAAPVAQPSGGPNTGGTRVTIDGQNFESNPQVNFGNESATTIQGSSATQIQATAPANATIGPVNLIAYFPSGWLALAPRAFSYGPKIQEILPNAGNPGGGDSVAIYGYGFGTNPGQVTVAIGGASATVQKLQSVTSLQISLGFDAAYPFPLECLTVQTPPGTPGDADVSVTSPAGSFTLSRGFQYLQSEQVYANPGFYKFLLYDQKRQWIYLSNIDHVDVFDLATAQFRTPIEPPGGPPPNADLRGLALTPDGSTLAVADFGAQSVYLFNPDTASGNAVFVGGVPGFANSGPARVAATSAETVFVGLTAVGSSGGCATCLGQMDLATSPVTVQTAPQPQISALSGAPLLQSSAAGDHVFFSFQAAPGGPIASWNSSSPGQFATLLANSAASDLAVAADGTVFASRTSAGLDIRDANMSLMGSAATSEIERISGRTEVPGIALHPSGALLYVPFLTGPAPAALPITGVQGGVDIVDTHTGRLRMRIILPEPLAMLAADSDGLHADFLTVDENGQRIFALTATGLTVIQLASVPLSIGSVSPSSGPASGGTALTIRGSGFQSGITLTIGGKSASVTVKDMNTLTFTTPALSSGSHQITLTNPSGETYSLPSAFLAQ
jgi:IPT/TIG domain